MSLYIIVSTLRTACTTDFVLLELFLRMIIFVFAQLFGVGLQKLPFEFENNAELSISLAVMAVGD